MTEKEQLIQYINDDNYLQAIYLLRRLNSASDNLDITFEFFFALARKDKKQVTISSENTWNILNGFRYTNLRAETQQITTGLCTTLDYNEVKKASFHIGYNYDNDTKNLIYLKKTPKCYVFYQDYDCTKEIVHFNISISSLKHLEVLTNEILPVSYKIETVEKWINVCNPNEVNK